MKARLIAAACLLGYLCLPGATASCGPDEYECDNNNCVTANTRFLCDGANDCGDWSDETICNSSPQGSLLGVPVGSGRLRLTVETDPNPSPSGPAGGDMTVAVCGPTSCCGHVLRGLDDSWQPLGYTFKVTSNTLLGNAYTQQSYGGLSLWLSKNTIDVEKHNQLFAVWPTGKPEFKRWIECFPNETNVVVGSSGFLRSVNILDDNSLQPLGPVLQSGEHVVVRLNLVPFYGQPTQLTVGLCGQHTCAVVIIREPRTKRGGTMKYSSGIIENSNDPSASFTTQIHSPTTINGAAWTDASYNISVALHPDGFLQVWQDEQVAEVPVPDDVLRQPTLKVLSNIGNLAYTSLGVQAKGDLPTPSLADKNRRAE